MEQKPNPETYKMFKRYYDNYKPFIDYIKKNTSIKSVVLGSYNYVSGWVLDLFGFDGFPFIIVTNQRPSNMAIVISIKEDAQNKISADGPFLSGQLKNPEIDFLISCRDKKEVLKIITELKNVVVQISNPKINIKWYCSNLDDTKERALFNLDLSNEGIIEKINKCITKTKRQKFLMEKYDIKELYELWLVVKFKNQSLIPQNELIKFLTKK